MRKWNNTVPRDSACLRALQPGRRFSIAGIELNSRALEECSAAQLPSPILGWMGAVANRVGGWGLMLDPNHQQTIRGRVV